MNWYLRHGATNHNGGVDRGGWARVADVLRSVNAKMHSNQPPCTEAKLRQIIESPRRRRFLICYKGATMSRIRAVHGQTIKSDVRNIPLLTDNMFIPLDDPDLSPISVENQPLVVVHMCRIATTPEPPGVLLGWPG